MITLTRLHLETDGSLYAVWRDEEDGLGYEFAALHGSDGRAISANFGRRPPRLTAGQIASATPPAHPVEALLAKLLDSRPDLTERGQKAARLVRDGRVRLTGPQTAIVTGDSGEHDVTGHADKCDCTYGRLRGDWCSHRLAVRMARALGQPPLPLSDEEKEARCGARAQASRETQISRNITATRNGQAAAAKERQKFNDGEGARAYMRMAFANGAATVPADIYQRATGDRLATGGGK